ncbi:MAG: hypothetical protein H6739_34930 [Alphaproteobacteria bacterium]|nr:hypothetical protein [Alphaproteobacteria bacterium]
MTYPLDKLRAEVAFIAYHLHWSLAEILELPHRERVQWVGQVSNINKAILESER